VRVQADASVPRGVRSPDPLHQCAPPLRPPPGPVAPMYHCVLLSLVIEGREGESRERRERTYVLHTKGPQKNKIRMRRASTQMPYANRGVPLKTRRRQCLDVLGVSNIINVLKMPSTKANK